MICPAGRFWSKVDVSGGYASCWEWTGALDKDGYGSFRVDARRGSTKRQGAHRVCYEMLVRMIPTGLQPDHLCRNRRCVNPLHMELVTTSENILRSECPAAINKRKTHCPLGHEYVASNTYVHNGKRQCRTCWTVKKSAESANVQ